PTAILPSPGSRRRSTAGSGSTGGRREPASGFVPGDDERLGVRREQVDCFAKGYWGLVIEGRGFHRYTH
ncbi:MAG TPA: hypothetical protein VHT00_07065, partial [Stellaceae bacterium]|nr:hypothetical protein [Stellaceae bacterium]